MENNNVGIVVETRNNTIKSSGFELLSMAVQAGKQVSAILFNCDPSKLQNDLNAYGVQQVITVTLSEPFQTDQVARTLVRVAKQHHLQTMIGTASALGKDLMPRVAARLNAGMVNDCISIDLDQSIATKPVFASQLLARIQLTSAYKVFTLRPNSYSVIKAKQPTTSTTITFPTEPIDLVMQIREIVQKVSHRIDLTEAKIIVAGGRGIKSQENFTLLHDLADVLGAAVGTSRAAVDAGFASHDIQVGQTGKTVNPTLYIACGISGATQHVAGMKTAKVIVAINKDPQAPIFNKADYGIVGDLFEVVPLLTAELKKVMGR